MPEPHSMFSIRSLLADTDVFNKFSIKIILADRKVQKKDGSNKATSCAARHNLKAPNSTPLCRSRAENTNQVITYSSAIAMAIRSSPDNSLPLQAIYRWIERKYPHFASNNENWRDTVRYNLSHNKIFVRVPRPANDPGRGKYWTIDATAEYAKNRSRGLPQKTRRHECQLYQRSKWPCSVGLPHPHACAPTAEQYVKCALKQVQQAHQAWNIYTHYQYHQYEI